MSKTSTFLVVALLSTIFANLAYPIPHSRPLLAPNSSPSLDDYAIHFSDRRSLSTRGLSSIIREAPQAHPRALSQRTDPSLATLQIPTCALACYITTLTTDGCASETDLRCHCTTGDLLGKAATCVQDRCDKAEQEDADNKWEQTCQVAGVRLGGASGGDTENTSESTDHTSTEGGESSTKITMTTTITKAESSEEQTSTSSHDLTNSSPTAVPTPSPTATDANSSAFPSTPNPATTTIPRMPTDTPLAPLPNAHPLSPGAKAGISLSVSLFASAVLLSIFLYIRHLKRDLALAQAAASVPESVWRASKQTSGLPSSHDRSRSWGGRGRRRSRGGEESPVSPLSPRSMGEIQSSIPAILKRKRGHVLSVVVEREDEDSSSSLCRIVHEPVPGQKEGLVDPLELDGEDTGIVELPTSVTPRARSMERNREIGSSLGESSRPSTSGLEKIDERMGI